MQQQFAGRRLAIVHPPAGMGWTGVSRSCMFRAACGNWKMCHFNRCRLFQVGGRGLTALAIYKLVALAGRLRW